ncbi:hypothetical protein GCM10022217_08250 [Chryseobacterium ginsenosidimutans]|uniref:hypothetical protein n=1 Tax=Chryseobacterium ginsenosidimutans TaxID=687846 RepID=UPI0031E39C31
MGNIENILLVLHQIEDKFNALEIEKEKLTNPRFFDPLIVNNEIAKLEKEILPMKKLLMSEKDIQRQKDLMRRQITEYIDIIGRRHPLPFSKKQGYIGDYQFYIKLFIDIKSILFKQRYTKPYLYKNVNSTTLKNKLDQLSNKEYLIFLIWYI